MDKIKTIFSSQNAEQNEETSIVDEVLKFFFKIL
jgi:hypothetical protein